MSLDTDQYRQLFIEEAKEHIETITKSMLILEKEPENQEVINALFRSAHTLKGSSGMMGFKDFQELTHDMEDIFDDMRKGNRPSCSLITALLECIDALAERLEKIQNRVDDNIEVEKFKSKLQEARSHLQNLEPSKVPTVKPSVPINSSLDLNEKEKEMVNKAESSGEQCFMINFKFSDDCSFKTIRAGMVLDKIMDVAKIVKSVPRSEEFDEEKLSQGFKMVVTSKFDEGVIEKCGKDVLEVEAVSVSPFSTSPVKVVSEVLPSQSNYM
ncbi:MAG TPA: Hpt domain-containing protein, partial [Candidatus Acidoferrum sp.]|nr:Hpt domain-containing protein [Candidatus Acidoferrum sp.]